MDNDKLVTSADNGKTIRVDNGETVIVRLRENATTGYRWDFDELDDKMVQVERADFARASDAIGSGGEAMWAVKPQTPGTARVQMKLWREWEGEQSIKDRFSFTLKVEGGNVEGRNVDGRNKSKAKDQPRRASNTKE